MLEGKNKAASGLFHEVVACFASTRTGIDGVIGSILAVETHEFWLSVIYSGIPGLLTKVRPSVVLTEEDLLLGLLDSSLIYILILKAGECEIPIDPHSERPLLSFASVYDENLCIRNLFGISVEAIKVDVFHDPRIRPVRYRGNSLGRTGAFFFVSFISKHM